MAQRREPATIQPTGAVKHYYPVLSRLHIPQLEPRTDANESFDLYPSGWTGEGTRHERLLTLAARFAPIVHSTNFSIPRDVEQMLALADSADAVACRPSAALRSEVWRLDKPSAELAETLAFEIGSLAGPLCPPETAPDPEKHRTGLQALRVLLDKHAPDKRVPVGRGSRDTVLFWDFPGQGPGAWRRLQWRTARTPGVVTRTYAHPLVYGHRDRSGRILGYEFVIQYWFFYPFNDGVNDHEGDWEHINVSVSTRERMREGVRHGRLLTEAEVRGILEEGGMPLDSLVISAVDYYFHHFVVTLDYKPLHDRRFERDTALYDWDFQERFGAQLVTSGATDSSVNILPIRPSGYSTAPRDTAWLTRPVIYLGGINKSVLQLLISDSQKNHNTNGCFPWPGLWLGIGTQATEQIKGKAVEGQKFRVEKGDGQRSVTFGRDDILILPDWEALYPRLTDSSTDIGYVRRWAWLTLPIRWGWPVTRSVGSALIEDYDFGNVSPVGPAHNSAWNKVATGPGRHRYTPHADRRLTRRITEDFITPESWALTVPALVLTFLPPISALSSPVASFVKEIAGSDHTIFQPTDPPRRVFDVAPGISVGSGGEAFALPLTAGQISAASGLLASGSTRVGGRSGSRHVYHMSFVTHLSSTWGTEAAFLYTSAELEDRLRDDDGLVAGTVRRHPKALEILGAFRWNARRVPGLGLEPFAKVGYGWSWYGMSNQAEVLGTTGEEAGTIAVNRGARSRFPLGFLPNSGLIGIGVELPLTARASETGLRLSYNLLATRRLSGRSELVLQIYTGLLPTPRQ